MIYPCICLTPSSSASNKSVLGQVHTRTKTNTKEGAQKDKGNLRLLPNISDKHTAKRYQIASATIIHPYHRNKTKLLNLNITR